MDRRPAGDRRARRTGIQRALVVPSLTVPSAAGDRTHDSLTHVEPDEAIARRVLAALRSAHGSARRSDIATTRPQVRALAHLAASGLVVRVSRGVYAVPDAPDDVRTARRASGLLTCVSAARRWNLPLVLPARGTHVAVPRDRGARRPGDLPAGTVVHRDTRVPAAGVALTVPPPVALGHLVRCLPLVDAVAAMDAALRIGLVSRAGLLEQRPSNGALRFAQVVRASDGRSQSIAESFVRVGLRAAGLTAVPQVMLDGVGRVDLLVEDLVVVELDGYAFHSDRAQFAEDRRRDRVVRALGLHALRFTFHDAVHDTARTVAEITAAVEGSRWRQGRGGPARRSS